MTTYYVDPAAGGSNNGTSWTDAWTSLQSAADTAVAGDTVYCRGTQNLSTAIDFDTNAGTTNGGFIKFIGCNASGNVDGTYFVLNGQDNNIDGIYLNAKSYIWLENIKVHSCNGTAGINTAASTINGLVFNNVWCHDNGGNGLEGNGEKLTKCTFFRCRFTSNTGIGWNRGSNCNLVGCQFNNNGSHGFYCLTSCVVVGCIFHGNTGTGMRQYYCSPINCIFDDNDGDGCEAAMWGWGYIFLGCRFTNNNAVGKVGLKLGERAALVACYFGNNTTDITSGKSDSLPVDGGSLVTTGGSDTNHGYTDQANDDFNLRSDATYRAQAIELD